MRPVKEMSLAVEWLPEEWPDYYSESEATASGNAPYNSHTTLLAAFKLKLVVSQNEEAATCDEVGKRRSGSV